MSSVSSTASSTALSGMRAAQTKLDASANNVANANTEKFRRQEVTNKEDANGGVTTQLRKASQEGAALETDMVAQLQAKNSFLANLSVFKSSDKMAGALLDATA
jgi:flagellar basal body rod protein FlgC